MKEAPVEEHLRDSLKPLGGRCIKLNPQNAVGIPDRLVICKGRVFFVELKRPRGGVISATQRAWHRWLGHEQHQNVEVLYTKEAVNVFIAALL